ncbi:hypothetical protein JTE90_018209 [Oedothorax gibbosus]|uniref:Uncharacterized protein n=1 Tax=Oedothorax gibbosus TaxID=931172 RepID=A0AAV6U9C5_9ARAC|nr:hypothetical protein JTE90_018209 [Oedothorax gibbosus]
MIWYGNVEGCGTAIWRSKVAGCGGAMLRNIPHSFTELELSLSLNSWNNSKQRKDAKFERRCLELTNAIKEARAEEIQVRVDARAVEQKTADAMAAREVKLSDSLAGFSTDFNERILPILERVEASQRGLRWRSRR